MKSFYSLIKISPNDLADDSLSIGLILSTPKGFKVKFSKIRKQLVISILSFDSNLYDFIEQGIHSKVTEQNNLLNQNSLTLFSPELFLTSDYFEYLSRYSNGLLKFSAPKLIADEIDNSKFEKLFSLLVDNSIEITAVQKSVKQIEKTFYQRVNDKLISRVENKVHTHQQFTSKLIPSLFSPFQMDCIGLNGVFVGAKSLPFTQSKETLHKSVNTYISVIAQLGNIYNKPISGNKFYLIADQPDKKTPAYHLWKQLFSNEKMLSVISSNESDLVAENIEQNNATTFLS